MYATDQSSHLEDHGAAVVIFYFEFDKLYSVGVGAKGAKETWKNIVKQNVGI